MTSASTPNSADSSCRLRAGADHFQSYFFPLLKFLNPSIFWQVDSGSGFPLKVLQLHDFSCCYRTGLACSAGVRPSVRPGVKNPSSGYYSHPLALAFLQKKKQPEIQELCISLPLSTDYLPSFMHNIKKKHKRR
jgi:hypothetical protein